MAGTHPTLGGPRGRRPRDGCRVLLVGGGTGGHVSPLLAVAEALRETDPETALLFIGGRRGLEADLVRAAEIPFHATAMPSLRDPDSRMSLVRRAFVIPLAAVDAWWQALRFHASVCCTTGGLVSLPAVLGARAAGVPVYLWEGNVVPGRTNRLLARVAARVGTTFDESKRSLPRGRTAVVGTPIRRSLLAWKRDSGRLAFAAGPDDAVVLVTGGSQGSERLNDAVFAALARLLRRAVVIHVVGAANLAMAEARRANLPAELRERYRPRGFLRDEMGAALAAADVFVGRAGSSSIAEPLAFGTPMVLVPFGAAADAHQLANARAVAEAGAAAVIQESELDGDRVTSIVTGLLDDRDRLRRMAAAARKAGRPDAARQVAAELRALGGCG
ncbi:MAG: undecaprenyldiphospho-muramoylpentapeptide beta-N-acetylglucosaminyltransferase [Chloroflexi bacterium]|nr:MAG: undecaprenyldiphospho-muramoylpentapeptide beta-N-acetylglucosaminyltransferase [Chloroflexota bacterium]